MPAAMVLFDALYLILATSLYGCAAYVALLAGHALVKWIPWPLLLVPCVLVGIAVLLVEVALLIWPLPRLTPGRHPFMGKMFVVWSLRMLLRRILMPPGLKMVLFSSNTLRFLTLRILGAKVAFSSNMSSDVDLLDPSLLTIGPGATIGSRCLITGHYAVKQQLVLGEVQIGARTWLAAEVLCAPDVVFGDQVTVKGRASFSVGARIEDGATIGAEVMIDSGARIGAGAQIGNRVFVPAKTQVKAGDRLEAATNASSTINSAAPTV